MIEGFHCQLKASLQCSYNTLSGQIVLLGICTALKEHLQYTTAELVYRTTLRLPGEIFTNTGNSFDDPASYITRLKTSMSQVKSPPVCTHHQNSIHVSNYLSDCTHVFVRNNKVRSHYNHLTMAHSRCSNVTTNIVLYNYKIMQTLFHLID